MSKKTLPLADVLGHEASDKRIDILRRIGQAGSISEAARGAGVSYKAAWQALETLANLAGTPLVEKAVGGSGGGGAVLTPAGQRVLQAADELARARQDVLARLGSSGDAAGRPGMAALALRTSMRNQFPCTVGALSPHTGLVRVKLLLADGGTLFLDEIGDMPLALQSKLLRALQEGEIEPLGSNKLIPFDARVIAATSRDLARLVREGSFREDLFYRLNVLPVRVPALRWWRRWARTWRCAVAASRPS